MTTDREAAEVIRSWVKEEAELDDAGLHRVLARLPDTPQRRHRWLWLFEPRLLARGATRSADRQEGVATGRSLNMLNATRAIALVAILALGGSLALIVGPLEREPESLPPAAETPPVPMDGAVHFTGQQIIGIAVGSEKTGVPGGVTRNTGGTGPLEYTGMTDPRLNGAGTYTSDFEVILGPTGSLMNMSTTAFMENEDGAWRGQGTGSFWMGMGAASGEASSIATVWLTGEGGYEGLGGFLILTDWTDDTSSVEGWIFPSGAPPFE